MTSRSDQNQGYSPKGLKQREQMIANGADPRTIVPSSVDGSAVYDRDRAEDLQVFNKLEPAKNE